MTNKDVIELFKRKQGSRTQTDIARELEVTPQYINDVLKGDKPPSDKILVWLGLERRIVKAK